MDHKKKQTVLLVEDEIITAITEKKILEKYHYKVITAENGEKAIEIADTTPWIDLILMDINLGDGISGTEAAEIILEKKDLPLIFLSSHVEREIVEQTEGITSYGYIVKHTGETVLLASIKMAFRLFEARLKEKEHEKALRENERQLNTLISNLPGFIYRCRNDKDWTMEYISDGCIAVTGYTPDDLLYNNKLTFNDIIHPDYQNKLWDKWQELLSKGEVVQAEYPIYTANGEIRWIWEKGRGIYSDNGQLLHLEGFIQDVTDRISWNPDRDLPVNQPSIAFFTLDLDLNIITWDKNAEEFYGWTVNEIYGKPVTVLVPFGYKKGIYKNLVPYLLQNNVWEGNIVHSDKEGRQKDINASISLVRDLTGEPVLVQCINRKLLTDAEM